MKYVARKHYYTVELTDLWIHRQAPANSKWAEMDHVYDIYLQDSEYIDIFGKFILRSEGHKVIF